MSAGTSVYRGRDQESFLVVDLTGSTGRTLTAVEAAAKTLRFTGTLGASITMRVPLSGTENRGYTGTYENQTSGGYTITVSPVTGAGVDVAPGSAITAFYDGVHMVGQAAAAATGFPVDQGGVISFYPITIQDPVIGDAVTWTGSGFENVPATPAIGGGITSGTVGSVLFVGTGPVLAQDNTNFFWDDTNNRLGLGTASPQYRLHVKDPTTFSSVTFELGDDAQQAAVRLYPGIAASGGNTLVETGGYIARGFYWTGAASIGVDGWMRLSMGAVTPTYYLALGVGATDRFWIRQDGQTTIGASTPTNSGSITEAIVLGGTTFVNGQMRFNATINVALPTANGPQWGTAADQTQAWWGGTAGPQMSVQGATTDARLDYILTQMGARGLIAPYISPNTVSTYYFFDARTLSGNHGDAIGSLTDLSGSARTPTAAGGARGLLQKTSNTSPNGSQLVRLDGVDDQYFFSGATPNPGGGLIITVGGNFRAKGGVGQAIFGDDTSARPLCVAETNPTLKYGWGDANGSHVLTGAFSAGWQVVQWVFRSPAGGTGVGEVYRNGVSQGTALWDWNYLTSAGFYVSGNAGGNVMADVDLGMIHVAVGDTSAATVAGLRGWVNSNFGT